MVVDGDPAVRREVRTACEQDGYQVLDAETGAEALRLHTSAHPILALLEVSLPDGSGYDVCRELRRTDPTTPVIMMSGRSDEIDVVVALEIGADDYVTKPLRLRELAARVAAHLRRARMESAEALRTRLEFRDLIIDVNERRIYKSGKEVELTHTEFDLLTFLASNAGKVLSREKILNGLLRATEKRPIPAERIHALVDKLEAELMQKGQDEVHSSEIGERVMAELHQLDEVAYVRFASVYRHFKDLNQFLEELRSLLK